MKNSLRIFVIILTLVLLFSLSACQTSKKGVEVIEGSEEVSYTADQIAEEIMKHFASGKLPSLTRYIYGAEIDSENYIDDELFATLFTGELEPLLEMEYIADYSMIVPDSQYAFEIDVLKVADSANITSVSDLLHLRMEKKNNGDIRNYNKPDIPILDNMKVIVAGDYVIMLATTDNDAARNTVSSILKGAVSIEATTAPPAEETTEPPTEDAEATTVDNSILQIEPEIIFDINSIKPIKKSGLSEDQQTAMPKVKVSKYSEDKMYCLGGTCEVGGVITVTGGTHDIVSKSDFGDWLVEVPINEGAGVLSLTVRNGDKAPSDAIQFIVKPQKGINLKDEFGIYGVIVGYDYRNFFIDCLPDYIGSNILKDNELKRVQTNLANHVADIKEAGLNTEIIYVLITNPSKIYNNLFPVEYTEYTGDVTLTTQFKQACKLAGITVIDLEDTLMAHKDDYFKIYHKTDSHWTDYGAMWGYFDLMNYIAQKWPDAAPRPETDFSFSYQRMYFGDIYYSLGLDRLALNETTVVSEFLFDTPTGHRQLWDQNNVFLDHNIVGYEHETKSNITGSLPSAYIMRDSFCGPLYTFLTDRFSKAFWRGMWNYRFDIKDIKKYNPDYLIYVLTERNIRNFMYE